MYDFYGVHPWGPINFVKNWGKFLTSPLGVNFDPQGQSCPPGVNLGMTLWPLYVSLTFKALVPREASVAEPFTVEDGPETKEDFLSALPSFVEIQNAECRNLNWAIKIKHIANLLSLA
jgi:hypothetical protein